MLAYCLPDLESESAASLGSQSLAGRETGQVGQEAQPFRTEKLRLVESPSMASCLPPSCSLVGVPVATFGTWSLSPVYLILSNLVPWAGEGSERTRVRSCDNNGDMPGKSWTGRCASVIRLDRYSSLPSSHSGGLETSSHVKHHRHHYACVLARKYPLCGPAKKLVRKYFLPWTLHRGTAWDRDKPGRYLTPWAFAYCPRQRREVDAALPMPSLINDGVVRSTKLSL